VSGRNLAAVVNEEGVYGEEGETEMAKKMKWRRKAMARSSVNQAANDGEKK